MQNALGDIEIDPEQKAEMKAEMLEFAECMREHGIDMADPVFSDDGRVTLQGPPPGADGPCRWGAFKQRSRSAVARTV